MEVDYRVTRRLPCVTTTVVLMPPDCDRLQLIVRRGPLVAFGPASEEHKNTICVVEIDVVDEDDPDAA